jgi:uncharacterized iron-regulated protein
VCEENRKKNIEKPHECYKDEELSGSMEAQLNLRMFKRAKNYGLRYKRLIADADSNTHAMLVDSLDYYVEKADCVEHKIRSLNVNLYSVTFA